MTTLAERRRLLKLTGWRIKSRVNPRIKPRAHLLWDFVNQTATIEYREKFDEETKSYLLWHELNHLVLIDISTFLKHILSDSDFKHYEELEERAVNQFAGALSEAEGE